MTAPLPPAPRWDWRDQTVCSLCAPHWMILTTADRSFLWRLARRRQVEPRHIQRLDRIVAQLDHYAQAEGINWP